jgi:ABC-2 type transport system permease protein
MGIDFGVVAAVFRKDMRQYLGNPTGYVFLTLFIATTAAAAFLQDGFFARNLADLAELNVMMPAILMFFVPAITMGAWAEERRGGTDELLLTMPVRDVEVVLGKYLGVLGMYTISLAFSLSNVGVLMYLGDPDTGLMMSTYLGYLMMGALFCAIGLVASMLTKNATVAFILGALGCAGLVFAGSQPWASGLLGAALVGGAVALVAFVLTNKPSAAGIGGLIGGLVATFAWLAAGRGSGDAASEAAEEGAAETVSADALRDENAFAEFFDALSVTDHFASFGEGVVRLGDVLYFAGGIVVLLYLASFLLGRRHW